MVAKYRPAMPIMTLVVPYLKRDGLKWKLEGRHTARQALLTSGLLPMLAAPTPSGEPASQPVEQSWLHAACGCMPAASSAGCLACPAAGRDSRAYPPDRRAVPSLLLPYLPLMPHNRLPLPCPACSGGEPD